MKASDSHNKRGSQGAQVNGKGRCIDNTFIERLRRSLKYECVYLHAWETGSQAKAGVASWMSFYNHRRPHTAHGGQPPALVYWQQNETHQPGQQERKVTKKAPETVQPMGSMYELPSPARDFVDVPLTPLLCIRSVYRAI